MRPSADSCAQRSPLTLAAILFTACLFAVPAIADRPSEPAAMRAAIDRAASSWEQARGLTRAPDALARPRLRAVLAARTAPTDSADAHWRAGYGLPVPDGPIQALLPHGDGLVVGGKFSRIGDMDAPGIAAWDGSSWSELPGYDGQAVLDLAPYPGGFVALGYWGVRQWDGRAWHELGFPSEAGGATVMAVLGNTIAVGYWDYPHSDGRRARVALYDARGWTPLGGDFDQAVNGLEWYSGKLYAGGEFTHVDGAPVSLVAGWDGTTWKPVGTGLIADQPGYSRVMDLAVFGGEMVAGGHFRDASIPHRFHDFARWNGTRWAPLGTNVPVGSLTRFRTIGTELYAVGQLVRISQGYGVARWDGAAWHVAEDQLEYYVHDVAQFGGDLYAGGALDRDGMRPATPLVRRRDGVWESPIRPTSGMNGLTYAFGPYLRDVVTMNGDVFVAGRFQATAAASGWRRCTATARWDGSEWTSLGMESWAVTEAIGLAEHQGSLYAIGTFQQNETGPFGSLARLAGGGWELLDSRAFLNAYCAVSAFGKLFVGGHSSSGFGGIATWDGATWHGLGGITRDKDGSWVVALERHGDDVIAGGRFVELGGVPFANIAAWNPATGWRALGDGLNGDVNDLLSMDGALYACGAFTTADGMPAPGLAQWRHGQWSALPPPPGYVSSNPWVTSLGRYRGRLVVGSRDIPGNIAMLDPDGTWRLLGSGVNETIAAFAENGPSLFVCGSFSEAGRRAAYGIAEWRDRVVVGRSAESPLPAVHTPQMKVTPNPSAAGVILQYELAAPARVRIEIFDLVGHLVERAFEGDQIGGPQEVVWRPVRNRTPPGLYFARLVAGRETRIVSFVRVE